MSKKNPIRTYKYSKINPKSPEPFMLDVDVVPFGMCDMHKEMFDMHKENYIHPPNLKIECVADKSNLTCDFCEEESEKGFKEKIDFKNFTFQGESVYIKFAEFFRTFKCEFCDKTITALFQEYCDITSVRWCPVCEKRGILAHMELIKK